MGKTKKAVVSTTGLLAFPFYIILKVYHGWMNTHGLLPLRLLE